MFLKKSAACDYRIHTLLRSRKGSVLGLGLGFRVDTIRVNILGFRGNVRLHIRRRIKLRLRVRDRVRI